MKKKIFQLACKKRNKTDSFCKQVCISFEIFFLHSQVIFTTKCTCTVLKKQFLTFSFLKSGTENNRCYITVVHTLVDDSCTKINAKSRLFIAFTIHLLCN